MKIEFDNYANGKLAVANMEQATRSGFTKVRVASRKLLDGNGDTRGFHLIVTGKVDDEYFPIQRFDILYNGNFEGANLMEKFHEGRAIREAIEEALFQAQKQLEKVS